jgi:hypothetical protein
MLQTMLLTAAYTATKLAIITLLVSLYVHTQHGTAWQAQCQI